MAVGEAGKRSEAPGVAAGAFAWPRALVWAALLCLLVGLSWRSVRFLVGFPIWGDEAMILVDVLDRDYHGLTQTLSFIQVAPLLFLWGEKTALALLGTSELAVRVFPFLAGSLGLVLFAANARRVLSPVHGTLAIALLAVSYYPLRHCCEVKPYGLDLLMSVGMLFGATCWLADPRRTRWLLFLALWAPLAMLSSYPAPFVGGAMSLLLLPKMWHATWKARALYALFNLLMATAFLGHFFGIAQHQIAAPQAKTTHEHMDAAWRESFPPEAVGDLPFWLVRIHAGLMLAYPVGAPNGGSAASLLLGLLGAWHLWSRGQRSLLLACLLPFGLTLFAAFLHKYPYGGSARVAQHLAPMACILIAAGGACLLERIRMPAIRWRWACAVCLVLAGVGLAGLARDVCRPRKSDYDRVVRDLMQTFLLGIEPGDAIVLGNPLGNVPMVAEWYLRHERTDVTRAGAPLSPNSDGHRVWLWYFTDHPPHPSAPLWLLRGHSTALSVVETQSWMVPSDSPGDPPICCNLFRMEP
jgi:hypothetical protein